MSSPIHPSRLLTRCALSVCALIGGSSFAAEPQTDSRAPVVISSFKGDVHATSADHDVPIKVGSIIELPASFRVGSDGAIELQQGLTVVSAAANSSIDIPKSTDASQTLERITQTKGNVYYNVARRPSHKLNIETPFLVAVIKGTRFNVSATESTATVSLLEGSIEIHGGTGDVIDLKAGQMASGARGKPVQVMQMTTGDVIRKPTSSGKQAVAERSNPWDQPAAIRASEATMTSSDPAVAATAPFAAEVRSPEVTDPTSGSAIARGDDHGAGSALALNQLLTQNSAANGNSLVSGNGASNGSGQTSGPADNGNGAVSSGSAPSGSGNINASVPTGSGGSSDGAGASSTVGSSAGTGTANGSNSAGSTNASTGNTTTGAGNSGAGSAPSTSGSGSGGSGSGSGGSGSGSGSSGSGSGSSGSGSGSSGSGSGGSGSGSASQTTGTGNSNGNSSSSPTGGGSNSGSQGNSNSQGNQNSNGNGNSGTKTPGNSGHTVTPGSGTATTGASGKSSTDDSLISFLDSLLNLKNTPPIKKK